ncbi:MAG TPA: SprT family zinc-dependent metalloprotease [Beijerinckiaceae bacterium]
MTHAGDTYRIVLRRVRGARRFTLRVRNATADVVLTMPLRGSVNAARAFAESHAAWIGARLRRVPQAAPFEPGVIIPLRGMDHQIQHRPGARGNVWVEAHPTPDESAALALCVAGERPHVARRVSDHLKHLARQDLQAAVAAHCAKLDLRPKSITLRDPVSRWGSCSSAGALSFSWRLILAPAFVLDYLAAHEAAHLVHMNHSP